MLLDRLVQLSRDPSSPARRQLLHAVTDLFLVDPEARESAKADYGAIAEAVVSHMAADDRAAYAERVASHAALPESVAVRLANDPDIAVASLVLRLSPVLSDADLAAIALTHSPLHLLAIAERSELNEVVTNTLIERGDQAVLRRVSANDGARFSDEGLAGLLTRSAEDEEILHNLQQRAVPLPPNQAARLRRIAMEVASQAAADAGPFTPFTPRRRQAQARRLEVKGLVSDVQAGTRSVSDAVKLLASDDRVFDLAQIVSAVGGIPSAQVLKTTLDRDVSGIALACRAIGVDDESFRAVLDLRRSRLTLSERDMDQEFAAYAALPSDLSARALRFLKVRNAAN